VTRTWTTPVLASAVLGCGVEGTAVGAGEVCVGVRTTVPSVGGVGVEVGVGAVGTGVTGVADGVAVGRGVTTRPGSAVAAGVATATAIGVRAACGVGVGATSGCPHAASNKSTDQTRNRQQQVIRMAIISQQVMARSSRPSHSYRTQQLSSRQAREPGSNRRRRNPSA
jgi:hypothetical protein